MERGVWRKVRGRTIRYMLYHDWMAFARFFTYLIWFCGVFGIGREAIFHVLMDGEGSFGMLGCRAITEEIRFDLKWSVLWNVKSASFKKRW